MTARPQFQTLQTPGQVPSTLRPNRELWVNLPDRMLGTTDAGTAVPLLGVRVYSATATYATNAMVAKDGQILVARAAIPPGAFNMAQWAPLGGTVAAIPPDAAAGSGYVDGANTTLSVALGGAVAWNAYRTTAGAWKTREAGISAYMALDPAHGLRVYSASSAAAGATPAFTPLVDFSSPTQVDLPQGKISLSGVPAVALVDTATSTRMGMTQVNGLLTLGVMDAASVLTQPVTSFRGSDRALIHSGSVYLASADAVLYLNPANSYEWRTYIQPGVGDHVTQHRTGHLDVWRSSDGQRSWWSSGNVAMTLTQPGDLWLNGTSMQIAAGNAGFAFNAGSTDLKFSADNWHLGWNQSNGTLTFFNQVGTDLFHIDASGSVVAANGLYAPGAATVGSMNVVGHTQTITGQTLGAFTVNGLLTVGGGAKVFGNTETATLSVLGNAGVSGDFYTTNVHASFNVNAAATVSGNDVTATNIVVGNTVFALAQGYKPGGGVWADTSDARTKTDIRPYQGGLDEIVSLHPIVYRKRSNVSINGVPPIVSDKEFVGLIAQDAEQFMPEMFTQVAGTIDGAAITDLRIYDSTALVYALINAVKDLHNRVVELEETAV